MFLISIISFRFAANKKALGAPFGGGVRGRGIGVLFGLSFADKLSEKSRLISDGGMGGKGFSWHQEGCYYMQKSPLILGYGLRLKSDGGQDSSIYEVFQLPELESNKKGQPFLSNSGKKLASFMTLRGILL